MQWAEQHLDELARRGALGYTDSGPPATEPTSLAAIALAAYGRHDPARRAMEWLVANQASDGGLPVSATQAAPGWPTPLAVWAWRAAAGGPTSPYAGSIRRALDWILSQAGTSLTRTDDMGHDTTLVGWSWAPLTHSWSVPTAFNLLALRAAGLESHPRAAEAVALLVDRLLPTGGCNYGNTVVLGQPLRPHLDATGLVLLALAGLSRDERIGRSLEFLASRLGARTSAMSLAYGLLGLAAHQQAPHGAAHWLQAAAERPAVRGRHLWTRTLLLLAARGAECPLVAFTRCPQPAAAREDGS